MICYPEANSHNRIKKIELELLIHSTKSAA